MPTVDNMVSTHFCQDTDWKLLFWSTFSALHAVFDFEESGSGPSCLTNDIDDIKPSRSALSWDISRSKLTLPEVQIAHWTYPFLQWSQSKQITDLGMQ